MDGGVLLKVRMVGLCGSDLNSFRGLNPLVSFPRILGHEVCATVMRGDSDLPAGTDVALSPYTNCGRCASCQRGRPNACQFNQTLGVQRDGALTQFIVMPREKLFPARLTPKELCFVEPLTIGFHAVARGRITANDTVAVFGCGGVGLGAIAGSNVAVPGRSVLMLMTKNWKSRTRRVVRTRSTVMVKPCTIGCWS